MQEAMPEEQHSIYASNDVVNKFFSGGYRMDKKEVLSLVDAIMHEFASSYRSEAKQRVEEKFTANNTSSPKLPEWEECMEYINGTPKRWNELGLKNTVWVTSAKMCYEFIVRKIGR